MSEDKSKDKTAKESKAEAEASKPEDNLQQVMAGGGMTQSPLFWGFMIFIPIAITLFVSVKNARQEPPAVERLAEDISAEVKSAPKKVQGAFGARVRPSRGRSSIY